MNKLKKHLLLKWHYNIGNELLFHDKPQNRLNIDCSKIAFIDSKEIVNKNKNIDNNKLKVDKASIIEKVNHKDFNNYNHSENEKFMPKVKQNDKYEHIDSEEYRLALDLANRVKDLQELKEAVSKFDGCEIKKTAINTVFSDGNPNASIMLIGEAPGANEDKYGIPFCGQSGILLDSILLSLALTRKEVYITNTVFWRPPGNRRPTTKEIAICKPFVEKHIALVNPKLIILVGSTAVEALLQVNVPITSLRGRDFQYKNDYLTNDINLAVIFHPSYLLRQPLQKKAMWSDMIKIKKKFLEE